MSAQTPKNKLARSLKSTAIANVLVYGLFIFSGARTYSYTQGAVVFLTAAFLAAVLAWAIRGCSQLDSEATWDDVRAKQRGYGAGILLGNLLLTAAVAAPAISRASALF